MPPLSKDDALSLVKRRHPEWLEFQKTWRWLQDSLEGGERYKQANYFYDPTLPQMPEAVWPTYGYDPPTGERIPIAFGQIVQRNLIPHLSEMQDSGKDVYVMRLARTPVPRTTYRAVNAHLSRIFAHEVKRESADATLKGWWDDVDGSGVSIDQWMRKTVGPLFMVCGHLDIVFDYPRAPDDAAVETMADVAAYDLDSVLAGYILPENMLWWETDRCGCYAECLVFERHGRQCLYRHYTPDRIDLYDVKGDPTTPGGPGNVTVVELSESRPNPFGFVPIVRVFDSRKPRCQNTGQSRYEGIAELQKAIYNARSELILNDVFHSHPLLSGPEEYCQAGGKIKVGVDGILPMKRLADGTYQGWAFVDPPQGAADSLRTDIKEFEDEADRYAALAKPAGHATSSKGGNSSSVAQSGVSKLIDEQSGDDYLSEVAETLADAERAMAAMVLSVSAGERLDRDDIEGLEVTYPKDFNLRSTAELTSTLEEIQGLASAAGDLPGVETEFLERIVTSALPGLDDADIAGLHEEIEGFLEEKAKDAEAQREARNALALNMYDVPVTPAAPTLNTANQSTGNMTDGKSSSQSGPQQPQAPQQPTPPKPGKPKGKKAK